MAGPSATGLIDESMERSRFMLSPATAGGTLRQRATASGSNGW